MPLKMMTSCALRVSSIQNLQEKVKQKQNKIKFNSVFFFFLVWGHRRMFVLEIAKKGSV